MKIHLCLLLLLAACTCARSQIRGMQVEDILRLEDLSEMAIDPNGRYLAYVIKRAKAPHEYYQRDYLDHNGRADIWLYDLEEHHTLNLTRGSEKGEGYWNPVWSPGGHYLAMLSTRGNDNVRLYVWDRRSGEISKLSERGINTRTKAYGKKYPSTFMDPFAWINDREIVCQLMGEGQRPYNFEIKNRAQARVLEEWPKALRGFEATADVIESGIPVGEEVFEKGRLVKINVATARADTLANGYFNHLLLSHDKRKLLTISKRYLEVPTMNREVRFGVWDHLMVGIADLSSSRHLWLDIKNPASTAAHRWSPDGKFLVIRRKTDNESEYLIFEVEKNEFRVPQIPISSAWWGAGNELLAAGKGKDNLVRVNPHTGKITALIKGGKPEKIFSLRDKRTVIFRNEILHVLHPEGQTFTPLTPDSLKITDIVEYDPDGKLVVAANGGYYLLHLSKNELKIKSIPVPEDGLSLRVYDIENNLGLYRQRNEEGTFLWMSKNARFSKIHHLNAFVGDIEEGENALIEYLDNDGQPQNALLHYPSDYDSTRTYPVVVWTYFGSVVRGARSWLLDKQNPGYLNLLPLSEQGYLILIPSMPSKRSGGSKDDFMEMSKGVLPAVNALISMGIADSGRIAVGGQSYGGYSVYSLLTQTNRFKAAFALAGLSDLLSLYGKIDMRFRYAAVPYEHTFMPRTLETGQSALGGTPWTNTLRYLRNSPYYYVDRIDTPVLIIQGDLDFVALEQGESMFTALYRQGKRARFVRYWGEGHTLMSPANIRDMWERIFTWLDETMPPGR